MIHKGFMYVRHGGFKNRWSGGWTPLSSSILISWHWQYQCSYWRITVDGNDYQWRRSIIECNNINHRLYREPTISIISWQAELVCHNINITAVLTVAVVSHHGITVLPVVHDELSAWLWWLVSVVEMLSVALVTIATSSAKPQSLGLLPNLAHPVL